MPTKIFTTMGGRCPFGYHNNIDDNLCRLCPYYYRAGTGTFFWCNHPVPEKKKSVPKKPESVPKTAKYVPKSEKTGTQGRKRGRPPKNGPKSPVKTTKPKKR